jgi:hypothetical protein
MKTPVAYPWRCGYLEKDEGGRVTSSNRLRNLNAGMRLRGSLGLISPNFPVFATPRAQSGQSPGNYFADRVTPDGSAGVLTVFPSSKIEPCRAGD